MGHYANLACLSTRDAPLSTCSHALANTTGPGGEGILPSLAPIGAHGLNPPLEAMRLAAHSEGKMPSPPGPSLAVAARRLPGRLFYGAYLPIDLGVGRPRIRYNCGMKLLFSSASARGA